MAGSETRGKVYIVGAGPGDPELLTLKAARVLSLADVVLHDELVNSALLQHVRHGAIVENVGKRAGGKHYPQTAINRAIVAHARKGRCVVRLKGGDPSLFGRLAEELAALRAAELDFEIVPGITAATACAAHAAIPLTDRHSASSVMFLSGHSCAGNLQPDWEAAVASGSTIALYMPGNCASVAERLIHAGLRADTPCAIVTNATLSSEQIVYASLEGVAGTPIAGSPKLMLIGEVARAHEASSRAWASGSLVFERQTA